MTAQSTGGRVKADTAVETAILREAIKKEDKHIHLREDFRVTDPMKMVTTVVSPKPTQTQPQLHISDEEHAKTQMALDTMSNKQRVALLPPERYDVPQSSSQEYGWHMSKPLVPPSTLVDASRKSCEETRYASAYYAISGLTPFSRKDRGTPNAGD